MKDLSEILKHYGIRGKVIKTNDGPLIKQIEFLPTAGTKIKNIIASLSDIAREMGVSSLRVDSIDNSNNIGFEIPQEQPQTVDFMKIIDSTDFDNLKGTLPICLGVDIIGRPYFADLSTMPHLLVAGTTGSGKSVGLNTFILSLIKAKSFADIKFVLIDPKRIEFSVYNNQKYMLYPVITDNTIASDALSSLVYEMNKRYELFEDNLCKNIQEYNIKVDKMPYIVCVIDEFSDLINTNKKVENYIMMLAQKARACGIHIILATQRPSVDIVTGALKANFPTRLSYKVASQADSRTILDTSGAEDLVGRGDALFLAGNGTLKRIHGAYVSTDDIDTLLKPYRAKIKPIEFSKSEDQTPSANKNSQKVAPQKSWFRKSLEAWSSLRQREKKTIIAGAVWAVGSILNKSKKRK